MWPNPYKTANLVTFTEEILNGKLHFFVQWVQLRKTYFSKTINLPKYLVLASMTVKFLINLKCSWTMFTHWFGRSVFATSVGINSLTSRLKTKRQVHLWLFKQKTISVLLLKTYWVTFIKKNLNLLYWRAPAIFF